MESVSLRYAKALFDLGLEKNDVPSFVEDGNNIYNLFKDNPSIIEYLKSSFVEDEEKKKEKE